MPSLGKIIICPTPIGNISDVTNRQLEALKNSDLIYAEDTRVTLKLLNLLNVKNQVKRLDENTMSKDASHVIKMAKDGMQIAYCTDAGMPGVSDPGLRLVNLARQNDIEIEVLPGASAAINAYVSAGFNNPKFYFGGFFPRKAGEATECLQNLENLDSVLIFYESPKRLLKTLDCIKTVLPDREVAVCRELTKKHEEVIVDNAQTVYNDFAARDTIKGEIVIVINSAQQNKANLDSSKISDFAGFLFDKGLKTNDISKALQFAFDIDKNEAYQVALDAKK